MLEFPAWFYRGAEARLFKAGETVPNGWIDHPTDFNGAPEAAFDHDHNGQPGGSLPKRRGRPPKVRE